MKTLAEDPELVQGFIEEGTQNLQMIENGLLALEGNKSNLKLIDEIFRPFHTIKGVAGFLNLVEVNSFCHGFESVLDDARKGSLPVTDTMTDAVFEAIDALRVMVDSIDQSRNTGTYVAHGVDLDYFNHKLNVIRLNLIDEVDEQPTETASNIPVKAQTQSVSNVQSQNKGLQKRTDDSAKGKSETSVRVSTEKMDILLDLVGELVLTQNMVTSNDSIKSSDDKRLVQDIGQLKRITTALQDLSMSLRMVPIKELFQKMNRIVRDLAKKSGKKIQLVYEGEETEIDTKLLSPTKIEIIATMV
jgi:two-component system chemotaxis sensor kinase CheA